MTRRRAIVVGVWLLGVLAVMAQNVLGYEIIAVHDGGSIGGTVTFSGPRPVAAPVSISKDQDICGKTEKRDESLVLSENQGIQNAVVSLVNIQKGKRFSTKSVILDQKECRYAPHVLLAPVGSDVSIVNNDGILHNIHTYSSRNPPVNKAQPKFKKIIKEKFNEAEVIKVTCDAHAWMSGWFVIQEHPYYAVTDATGHFLIENIPPGHYEIRIWHESLQENIQPVDVMPKTKSDFNIELSKH